MHLFGNNEEFGLTDDQVRMRESVIKLLREKLPASKIAELDDKSEFPFEAYAALAEGGWLGLPHDEKYGGAGGSYTDLAVLIEAIAYHNAQMASAYLTTVVYGGMHLKFGASEQLRASLLPQLIAGKSIVRSPWASASARTASTSFRFASRSPVGRAAPQIGLALDHRRRAHPPTSPDCSQPAHRVSGAP